MTVWSHYFWPTGHFTKKWQIARHLQWNDISNNRFHSILN